ncbi:MAG: sulfatase-like hydrolase/transferase [Gemmataceae bacterium]|nr:sulfatase-like hydrolase/transferase [Gemmataceae bacterium]
MSMRRAWLVLVALMFAGPLAMADEKKSAKPNIVFIVADDLGWFDLGCYGRKEHRTPNLDKLASQGMRFTRAYASQSVCSPTRAALMTGKHPARLHLTTFLPGRPDTPAQLLKHPEIQQQLPLDEKTIAECLKSLGYATGLVGKWHLGNKGFLPTDQGFDFYHPGKALTEPSATEGGKGEYDLTNKAIEFVEKNKDRPFYLFVGHNNPHIALSAKKDLIAKNKDAFNPAYAAMIETLDDAVGKLIAKIDELGLGENTIIVFTSDNGGLHILESPGTPATHGGPFRGGKGFLYEGGLRIPQIVRWTGKIRPDQTTDIPMASADWFTTLLAAVGSKSETKVDGIDCLPLLLEGKSPGARALYWHQPHYMNQGSRPAGAIAEGKWKLIEHYESGACELFDLDKDIGETTDLGAKEPAKVAELRGKLEAWRREAKVQENVGNPQFNGKLRQALYGDVDVSQLKPKATAAETAKPIESWRTLMNQVLPKGKAFEPGLGAVLLHARDAKVHGSKLRYEPPPQKDTLGFWVDAKDWAEWQFEVSKAGVYEIEVLQACGKGSGGAEIEIAISDQKTKLKIEETGHFQRFVPRSAGLLKLEAGAATLTVRALSKPGVAVMDLRRITIKSAP